MCSPSAFVPVNFRRRRDARAKQLFVNHWRARSLGAVNRRGMTKCVQRGARERLSTGADAEFATRALEVTMSHLFILLISKSLSRGDVHDGNTVNVSSPKWEAACAKRRRVLVDCHSLASRKLSMEVKRQPAEVMAARSRCQSQMPLNWTVRRYPWRARRWI